MGILKDYDTRENNVALGDKDENPERARFLASCVWLRERHILAFILGLFTLGVPYAMAGIGGASSGEVPLVLYWSKRKIKWLACCALIGEAFYLASGVASAISKSPIMVLALPVICIAFLGVVEVLYEIFKKSDGFILTQLYSFDCANDSSSIVGPARIASFLISRSPIAARASLGLLWAWLLGAVYVATFIVGVTLAIMVGFILIALSFAALVIGTLLDKEGSGSPPPPPPPPPPVDPVIVYPPIPFEGYAALDEFENEIAVRRGDRIYADFREVGYITGAKFYYYTERKNKPVAVYELWEKSIYDLLEHHIYAEYNGSEILAPNGELLYQLVEVSE
ncbi:MAG TPA: hypothetical protein VGL56_04480 [Fimbriimonadaceae bacterium]|jgi:hypothetical protein